MFDTVLLVVALVSFVVAFVLSALNVSVPRLNLIALGLACWVTASLI